MSRQDSWRTVYLEESSVQEKILAYRLFGGKKSGVPFNTCVLSAPFAYRLLGGKIAYRLLGRKFFGVPFIWGATPGVPFIR